MSAERDLVLALIRKLYDDGRLDMDDLVDIADMLKGKSEEHDDLAVAVKVIPIEAIPSERAEVEHRRRQMVLRTQWLENKKGERDAEAGGD